MGGIIGPRVQRPSAPEATPPGPPGETQQGKPGSAFLGFGFQRYREQSAGRFRAVWNARLAGAPSVYGEPQFHSHSDDGAAH